jgi:membrane protein required for colicin V production
MNWLDVLIVATIIWFALSGLSAGILREGVTFIAVVTGVIIAGQLYEPLANDLLVFNISERTAKIAAFLAIAGAMVLAGQVVALMLKRAASLLMIGPLDQAAGLLLGIAKGIVLVEGVLILFVGYPTDFITDAINGSLLSPFFLEGIPVLLRVLPSEFKDAVDQFKP